MKVVTEKVATESRGLAACIDQQGASNCGDQAKVAAKLGDDLSGVPPSPPHEGLKADLAKQLKELTAGVEDSAAVKRAFTFTGKPPTQQ